MIKALFSSQTAAPCRCPATSYTLVRFYWFL